MEDLFAFIGASSVLLAVIVGVTACIGWIADDDDDSNAGE